MSECTRESGKEKVARFVTGGTVDGKVFSSTL